MKLGQIQICPIPDAGEESRSLLSNNNDAPSTTKYGFLRRRDTCTVRALHYVRPLNMTLRNTQHIGTKGAEETVFRVAWKGRGGGLDFLESARRGGAENSSFAMYLVGGGIDLLQFSKNVLAQAFKIADEWSYLCPPPPSLFPQFGWGGDSPPPPPLGVETRLHMHQDPYMTFPLQLHCTKRKFLLPRLGCRDPGGGAAQEGGGGTVQREGYVSRSSRLHRHQEGIQIGPLLGHEAKMGIGLRNHSQKLAAVHCQEYGAKGAATNNPEVSDIIRQAWRCSI